MRWKVSSASNLSRQLVAWQRGEAESYPDGHTMDRAGALLCSVYIFLAAILTVSLLPSDDTLRIQHYFDNMSVASYVLTKLSRSITMWGSEVWSVDNLFAIIFFLLFFFSYSPMTQQPDVGPRAPEYNLFTLFYPLLLFPNSFMPPPPTFWNPLLSPSIFF